MSTEFDLLKLIEWLASSKGESKTLTNIADHMKRGPKDINENEYMAFRKRLERWLRDRVEDKILLFQTPDSQTHSRKKTPTRRYALNEKNELVRRLVYYQDAIALSTISSEHLHALHESKIAADMKPSKAAGKHEIIFRDHIRLVPDGIPRERAKVDSKLIESAIQAMKEERQLVVAYSAQDSAFHYGPESKEYTLNVYGLAFKETTVYLIGLPSNKFNESHASPKIQYYNLHRCKFIKLSEEGKAKSIQGFDIDDYIERQDNLTRIEGEDEFELVLNVHEKAIFHFEERRLKNQKQPEKLKDGSYIVRARIRKSVELEPFLWSHAPWVHVVSPPDYRRRVQQHLFQAMKRYIDEDPPGTSN